nr:ABC transporter ATP-binding protein [uncultured Blautia sp.]
MIEVNQCSKKFGMLQAVNKVSLKIGNREVFGLVGSNGAGKSTLLRMMAGIIRADEGNILVDGTDVYENENAKGSIFYIADDSYFPANFTPREMAVYYKNTYPSFQMQKYEKLMKQFHLEERGKINRFSKGMKKQLLVILGISAGTKYMLCDETFDGLDPVMRQAVKSLFAAEIMNRDFSPVIASHNLRELEDICDHVGLLHQGGILLSQDLEDLKFHIHKVQCVLSDSQKEKELAKELDVLNIQHQGSLLLITARGTRTEIMERIQANNPLFCEILPLTLEEIFISETEVAGYEIKNIFW